MKKLQYFILTAQNTKLIKVANKNRMDILLGSVQLVCLVVSCLQILYPIGKASWGQSASTSVETEEGEEGDDLLGKGQRSAQSEADTVWQSSNLRKLVFLLQSLTLSCVLVSPYSWFLYLVQGILFVAIALSKLVLFGIRDKRTLGCFLFLVFPSLARKVFMVAFDVYGVVVFLSSSRSKRSASISFVFFALSFLSPLFLLPSFAALSLYSISTEQRTRLLLQDESTPWENKCGSWSLFASSMIELEQTVASESIVCEA